ncbi:RrF2 family transcriptional regulator [Penaeicola halotolerans]|uniref:RrF2 family transcriptional regulator n=1 Tax=Penaeicola halotolerans TaxID=2793196 RepID=UPI001CF81C67|nr:Rrf2 family transcriptional regulator [Penaeicola halotolerans]
MFSRAFEHGIKAIIYIATQSMDGKRVKIGDIVEQSGSPEAFTAKVLGVLTKQKIINSHTGPYGGFDITMDRMKETTISEIVHAIDGDVLFTGCGLGLSECSHLRPCPMHDKFVKVRNEIKSMLSSTTIHDLALGLKSGKTVLMR